MTARLARPAGAVVAAAAVAFGLALRAWLLWHRPVTGDEAITGLMARQIRHGQFFTFFWGNAYGGGDQYVAAVVTAVSDTVVGLNAVATLVWLATALLVWRTARWLGAHPAVAAAAGLVTWVWPGAVLVNSTRELGIRSVAVAATVGLLLAVLRLASSPTLPRAAVAGLAAGIGWWASPEVVYVALPVAFGLWPLRTVAGRTRLAGAAAAGFVLGAGPWIATNLRTGFASLRPGSSPVYVHLGYGGRLRVALVDTVPMMLGLRHQGSGLWLGGGAGRALAVGLVAVVAVVAVVVVLAPPGRVSPPVRPALRGLGLAVLTFPLLQAAFPVTGYWQEGLYGVYLVPLLVLLVAAASAGLPVVAGARARGALALGAVVAVAVVTATDFDGAVLGHRVAAFTAGWSGAEAQATDALARIEALGVKDAWAEYWVANDLDLLDHGRAAFSDVTADRWVAEYDRVAASPDPAWVFFDPAHVPEATGQFSSATPGPGGLSLPLFTARLQALGVAYRVEPAGVLDVVVPARKVAPAEVGTGPPVWR